MTARLASRQIEVPESFEAVHKLSCDQGWGDGLPIIPPTEDRVLGMIEHVKRQSSEVVAEVPPLNGKATIEKIAINAVMAGCLPRDMPAVIAAVQAMCDPAFKLHGLQVSSGPGGPLLLLNGPVRSKLDINCGFNCMGQGRRANATIGRAVRFLLANIGGGIPGSVDMATHGWPGKYTFCFGENEEGSPWEPLHVERGFKREQSTVTVVGALGAMHLVTPSPSGLSCLQIAAEAMSTWGSFNMLMGGEPLVVLTPEHGSMLVKEGFTKKEVKRYLFERGQKPLAQCPVGFRRHMPGDIGFEPERIFGDKLAPCKSPDDIMVVVAGGPGLHIASISTYANGRTVTKLITD